MLDLFLNFQFNTRLVVRHILLIIIIIYFLYSGHPNICSGALYNGILHIPQLSDFSYENQIIIMSIMTPLESRRRIK